MSSPSPACGCRLFLSVQNFSTGEGYGIIEVLGEAVQAAVGPGGDPALGKAAQAGESAWQAAVAEPPMLPMLEDMIVSKYRANDPVWSALLGWWLTATGVLCYAHVMRSWPRRLSHSTFHGRCSRGKQRQNRQGLDFCIPAVFACSWPWGQIAARYARSLRTKHKVLVIAHALQAFDAWEVIPPEAVEAVLPAAEKAVGAAVAQDSAALWTSPAEKADIKKRLVMLKQRQSTAAVRQASGRRRGSHVEMPSAIKGKKVSPTLRDGALLCALAHVPSQRRIVVAGTSVPFSLARPGCGGNHTAAECREKRWVNAEVEETQPMLRNRQQ